MPFLLAHVIGNARFEAEDNFVFTFAGVHAEAVAQALIERKLLRALEAFAGGLDALDARGNEGANVFAAMVPGEQVPFTVDIREVVRIDDAQFGLARTRLAIRQLDLPPMRRGFGQRVKDFQVEDRLSPGAERNGLLHLRQVEGDGVWQRLFHFSDRTEQRLFETGAAILLERFLSDHQREQFAFSNLHRGKGADFLSVTIAKAAPVIFDRQIQAVAHEFDVAMDGFGADFQFAREPRRVGKFSGLNRLMNAEHAFQRRAGLGHLQSVSGIYFHAPALSLGWASRSVRLAGSCW